MWIESTPRLFVGQESWNPVLFKLFRVPFLGGTSSACQSRRRRGRCYWAAPRRRRETFCPRAPPPPPPQERPRRRSSSSSPRKLRSGFSGAEAEGGSPPGSSPHRAAACRVQVTLYRATGVGMEKLLLEIYRMLRRALGSYSIAGAPRFGEVKLLGWGGMLFTSPQLDSPKACLTFLPAAQPAAGLQAAFFTSSQVQTSAKND